MSNATARGHPEFFELGVEVDGPIHCSLAASPVLNDASQCGLLPQPSLPPRGRFDTAAKVTDHASPVHSDIRVLPEMFFDVGDFNSQFSSAMSFDPEAGYVYATAAASMDPFKLVPDETDGNSPMLAAAAASAGSFGQEPCVQQQRSQPVYTKRWAKKMPSCSGMSPISPLSDQSDQSAVGHKLLNILTSPGATTSAYEEWEFLATQADPDVQMLLAMRWHHQYSS